MVQATAVIAAMGMLAVAAGSTVDVECVRKFAEERPTEFGGLNINFSEYEDNGLQLGLALLQAGVNPSTIDFLQLRCIDPVGSQGVGDLGNVFNGISGDVPMKVPDEVPMTNPNIPESAHDMRRL